jgi:glucose/arabinose dehydrogenase
MSSVPPLAALAWLLLAACTDSGADPADPVDPVDPVDPGAGTGLPSGLRLSEVASGLERPVFLTAPPGDPRLFVVEQPGRVRVIEDGRLLATPFLDIASRVSSGGERGLLGLAFHPDFASNGLFFVNFTDPRGDTRIERFRVGADRNRADPASAKLILGIAQPFANHNGGMLAFGPDRKLYVGMGDGGSGGDPHGHGQNPGTLLGAMLRLDVDAGDPYAVPADNPFVGRAGARPEVWATGLRNPWRFAFDREAGMLYVADVGQNQWEEVSAVDAARGGLNFGWSIMEGAHCFRADSCDRAGLTLPVLEYPRSEGCSVTGGYAYRGAAMPGLRGHFFYSDYCRGWIRSFRLAGGEAVDRREWEVGAVGSVSSFGEDSRGELYVLAHGGAVYRLEAR